jgi:hypothetical protein
MVIFMTEEEAVEVLQRDQLVVGIVDPRQFNEEEAVIASKLLKRGGVAAFTAPYADWQHLPWGDKEWTIVAKFWVSPWSLPLALILCHFFQDDRSLSREMARECFSWVRVYREQHLHMKPISVSKQTNYTIFYMILWQIIPLEFHKLARAGSKKYKVQSIGYNFHEFFPHFACHGRKQ